MGKRLYLAKKLDFNAPHGDRQRISLALLLTSIALVCADILLFLRAFGVRLFALWLSVSTASFVLLFVALAVLTKELCRNRFFSAVVVFIATLLVTAGCIAVAVATH